MIVEQQTRSEEVMLSTDGRKMTALVVRPEGQAGTENGRRPGLIVIQEAFGLNSHIRDMTDRFARQGYVAISPDLYHRTGAGQTFGYDDLPSARVAMGAMTQAEAMADITACLDYISTQDDVDARNIFIVGYCMGGRLAYLAASYLKERLAGAAVYYGGRIVTDEVDEKWPVAPIDRTAEITCPVIGFFGGQDYAIPNEQVERIDRALSEANIEHEIYFYPDAGHGFNCNERSDFHPRAAQDAWCKTLAFFQKHRRTSS